VINVLAGSGNTDIPNNGIVNRRELQKGYYVIVGSFNMYENAQRYAKDLVKKSYSCDFAFSDRHHHYYTYVFYSDTLINVKDALLHYRKMECFKDSWILKITNNLSEKRLDATVDVNKENLNDEIRATNTSSSDSMSHLEELSENKNNQDHHHKDLSKNFNEYKVYVNPYDSLTQVSASIKVVNGENAVFLKNIESQKVESIYCPKSYSQEVEFIMEAFGYRKRVFYLDLASPVTDTTKEYVRMESDKIVIDLPMEQFNVGDIMVMYNVFFFPNSNILRAKSKYELQKLLDILKENPNTKVRIHGHVNGNSSGHITRLNEDTDDFFNPTNTEVINGSSAKLSELRAETIKYFLTRNGIEADRLETKGWGGKKMLHKEDSPLCEYNVRVEIEILEK
jgi:outer membrane protein OmpA-like peptidoglycan-associated protein